MVLWKCSGTDNNTQLQRDTEERPSGFIKGAIGFDG